MNYQITGIQYQTLTKSIEMVQLTTEQRTFIVKSYYKCRSYKRTREAFRNRFQDRQPPAPKTIWANVDKYEKHGTSLNRNKQNSGRRRSARSEANIRAVAQRLAEHPRNTSARRNGVGISSATFNRITRLDLHQHPYRMNTRHQLVPQDFDLRLQFAGWLINRCERNKNFLRSMVIGDEAAFALNGQVNTRNVREYAPARQPPAFNFDVNLSQQKLTVWLGLCGSGQVIGPFFFNGNVNGTNYLYMINNDVLPQLQEHFEQQIRGVFRNLWWAQDCAPAHRSIAVGERLRGLFGNRVIALDHNVEWPPRSPDLTPCDFFLWGYLKNRVFSSPPADLDDL